MIDLKAEREKRGLTLKAVKDATGIDPGHLCRFESGDRDLSPEKAKRLAEFYGLEIADVLFHKHRKRTA